MSYARASGGLAAALIVGIGVALLVAITGASSARDAAARAKLSATAIKPQITGLIDMGSQAPYHRERSFGTVDLRQVARDAPAFSGIVINETWAQLEPSPGTYDFQSIQSSLAAVTAYNQAHPRHPLAVRLRVFGGFTAPEWAKTMDGAPVTIAWKGLARRVGTVGRWWAADYRAAWSALQHALATSFDANPVIRSVAVSSCASLTGEPFVISHTPSVRRQLLADGWSLSAERQCLMGALADYDGWKRTPIDYAFNPLPSRPSAAGWGRPGMSITDQVMARCALLRSTSGRSCILSNHGLDQSATTSRTAPVYREIDALYTRSHDPVDLQTITPNGFGGCQAIALAVRHHAVAVELWPPSPRFRGYAAFSKRTLVSWAHALRRHHLRGC